MGDSTQRRALQVAAVRGSSKVRWDVLARVLATIIAAVALTVTGASVGSAPAAHAVTPNVSVTVLAQTTGRHTLVYAGTATAAGTLRDIIVTLPAGTGGSVTSINGTVRTVSPGVLRWTPTKVITVGIGARFSIPFYGLSLPAAGEPWALSFRATARTAATLCAGTAAAATTTVTASNPVPGQTTSLTYRSRATRAGRIASVRLYIPAGSTGRLTTLNGTLRGSGSYITWTPFTPPTMAVGSPISIPVNNLGLSRYGGSFILTMTAFGTDGRTLSTGSGLLRLIAPPAPMPAVPVTAITAPPPPCPAVWPSTAEENAKPGTGEWVIPTSSNGTMSAYLTAVSATCGESVDLKVDSGNEVTVAAYRMGYYQGLGARKVWVQAGVPTVVQPTPTLGGTKDGKPLYSASAEDWSPTLSITITPDWVPGVYLIRIDDGTTATYAPLTVRDDTGTRHDVLLQQATATWSAYNSWGGRSFYSGTNGSARLSYDRPYREGQGSGQFLPLEQGMVFWLEAQGVDVTYWTDEDLDEFGGQIPARTATLMLPAHDEYYSPTMRASLSQAIKSGINVASMGANTAYREIAYTNADRRSWDIDRFTAGVLSTRWRHRGDAYASQPLLGAEYVCPTLGSPMVTGSSWLFEGITTGTTVPGFLAGEIDNLEPDLYQHPGITKLFAGTAACRADGSLRPVVITAFEDPSGSRVFNASVFSFSCYLIGQCPIGWTVPSPSRDSQEAVTTMMTNVLAWVSPPLELATPKQVPTARVKAPKMTVEIGDPRNTRTGGDAGP